MTVWYFIKRGIATVNKNSQIQVKLLIHEPQTQLLLHPPEIERLLIRYTQSGQISVRGPQHLIELFIKKCSEQGLTIEIHSNGHCG